MVKIKKSLLEVVNNWAVLQWEKWCEENKDGCIRRLGRTDAWYEGYIAAVLDILEKKKGGNPKRWRGLEDAAKLDTTTHTDDNKREEETTQASSNKSIRDELTVVRKALELACSEWFRVSRRVDGCMDASLYSDCIQAARRDVAGGSNGI